MITARLRDARMDVVAKVLSGAYHFFRPKQDGAAQARFFLAQLEDPGELPRMVTGMIVRRTFRMNQAR